MLSHVRACAFAALFCSVAAPAAAQQLPAPAPSALPEIGRISTSDRHDEALDRTVRPTTVIERGRIDARGDRTIADALAGVPGIAVYRYGGFGAQAAVFLNGTSASSQVLVLLDGIPIAPASNGQVDLGELATAGVRRIEVVAGGGSTLYGSSAIGGVINIITSVPRGTYLEAATGSYGERDLRVETGTGRLGVSFERHLATNDYAYPTTATAPGGVRDNADARQTAARLSYDARLGDELSLRVRAGSAAIALGAPGDLAFGATPDARQTTSRNDLSVELTRAGERATTILTLAASRQLLDYVQPSLGPDTATNDGRAQISLREVLGSGAATLTAGIDLARETAVVTNVPLFDSTSFALLGYATDGHAQAQSALYVQEQVAGEHGLRAYAGVRAERDAPIAGVITPSAGFGFDSGALRVTANAAGAFRVPTLIDLYYPGDSNPALKPERARDANVTIATRFGRAGASLEFFGRDAVNLIALDGNFVPQNIARASVRGLTLAAHSAPLHGVTANLTVTDTYRALDLTPGAPATRLGFAPVFVTTLGVERGLAAGGRIAFGASATILGPHLESGGTAVNDGATTVDAYLRARVAPRTIASLRARNLGDERYSPVLGYPAPGRSWLFELATR